MLHRIELLKNIDPIKKRAQKQNEMHLLRKQSEKLK